MKTTARVMFAASLWLAVPAPSPAAAPADSNVRVPPERVELKVQKVLAAQDREFVYRAYLVEWHGQEVVVRDALAKTKYRPNDMITVLVMRHPYPQGKEDYGLLSFEIVPPRAK
ncbi:MAG: hypothetical protein NTV51_11770 [Verrucomicrobia bacterium]|nr:hypothetical protein [Verrucomicrobiota bacterium]